MAGLNDRLVEQAGAAALPALLDQRADAANRFLAGEISIDTLFQVECELGPLIAAAADLRRGRPPTATPRYPTVAVALNRTHHPARLRFDVQQALCSVGLWRDAEQFRRETRSCSHDLPRLLAVTQGWVVIQPSHTVEAGYEPAGRWARPLSQLAAEQRRSSSQLVRRASALAVAGVVVAVMFVGAGWRLLTESNQGGDDRPAVVVPNGACPTTSAHVSDGEWHIGCP